MAMFQVSKSRGSAQLYASWWHIRSCSPARQHRRLVSEGTSRNTALLLKLVLSRAHPQDMLLVIEWPISCFAIVLSKAAAVPLHFCQHTVSLEVQVHLLHGLCISAADPLTNNQQFVSSSTGQSDECGCPCARVYACKERLQSDCFSGLQYMAAVAKPIGGVDLSYIV